MKTNGNPVAGALAAALQAVEIDKLLGGDREHLLAGREALFDARHQVHLVSRLDRNPACRFSHEHWSLASLPDLPLGEALALAEGPPGDRRLFVPGHAFVSRLSCDTCGLEEVPWRLLLGSPGSLSGCAPSCPRCGARRAIRGFDLVEQLSADFLPPLLLEGSLAERGLRPGEVFGVASEARPPRYFALADANRGASPSGATDLVVAGTGNIGSFLAPLLARMERVGRVTLCDPDVYEPGQQVGQDIPLAAVGRGKAEVQAERMRAICPGLPVEVFRALVEELPLGALWGAITVSCLDSRAARLGLAARAWRVGSPFVDAAVGGGSSLLVRTNMYLPEPGAACFECAFEARDYENLDQATPCAVAA